MSTRRRLASFAVVAMLVAAASGDARAADPAPIDPADLPPPPERVVRWYGYQTLGVDLLSGALLVLSSRSALFGVAGGLGYVAGGPVIHGAHHRDGALGIDLVARVSAPVIGMMIGMATAQCSSAPAQPGFAGVGEAIGQDLCPVAGGALGFVGGMVTASIFDALVLGWETRVVHHEVAASAWAPTFALTQRGGVAGVGGAF